MGDMRRALELGTAAAGAIALGALLLFAGAPNWTIVVAFGAVVVVAENTAVLVHAGTAVSPGFMLVMATIAVADHGHVATSAALVGACNGIYLPYIRQRRLANVGFNCGQCLLSSAAAALAYAPLQHWSRPVGAVAAGCAYGVLNIGLVLPWVALKPGESFRSVWRDMRPAVPNYLSFGLLGLLVGMVGNELGPLSIVLLAIPMGIGRWTFRSFERTREAHSAAIRVFVQLIEAKDPYTAGHTGRVAKYSVYIGEVLRLDPGRLEHLRQSALMHDIGKLAVPARLLNKPGRLTPDEYEVVRSHNEAGIGILGQVDFMRTMAVTASDAHSYFESDRGATPSDLVLEAHIVAVADAFDAMTSTRSYRQALAQDVAIAELRRHAGTQFNPECVEALIAAINARGERYGLGFERDVHHFATTPPVTGVGSAGLGDLEAVP
jgi:HD superfamily phosphodiesterase